jgi:hypothetical protein
MAGGGLGTGEGPLGATFPEYKHCGDSLVGPSTSFSAQFCVEFFSIHPVHRLSFWHASQQASGVVIEAMNLYARRLPKMQVPLSMLGQEPAVAPAMTAASTQHRFILQFGLLQERCVSWKNSLIKKTQGTAGTL